MANNCWYTPRWLVHALKNSVGGFDLDPCGGCEPRPIASTVVTITGVPYNPHAHGVDVVLGDGLGREWEGSVFVNPPYGRYQIDNWAAKIHDEAERTGGPDLILALLPARMSADWWHDYVNPADALFVFTNRLRFGGSNNDGGFASVLAAYGDVPPELIETLKAAKTPATVYTGHEVENVWRSHRGDRLKIEPDLRGAAAPHGVDGVAEATVETVSVSDDGLIEVLAVQRAVNQDHETYFLLEFPRENPIDVRCSVARGIEDVGFRNVPIESVETVPEPSSGGGWKQATLPEVVA